MKAIKIVLVLLLVSCGKEPLSIAPPYYQFDADDQPYLYDIPINNNGSIKFKNQEGAILTFTMSADKTEKLDNSIGSFWGSSSTTLSFYDKQTVAFNSEEYFLHFPILSLVVSKGSPEELRGEFYFYLWNDTENHIEYFNLNEVETSSMTIDTAVYNKVITISSNSIEDNSSGSIPKNVHVVYIDLKNGLIGFDDLENNKWRLINSK